MKFKENLLVVLAGINLFKTNVLKSHILGIVLCMVDMTMNKYKDQEFGKQIYKQINPVDNRIEGPERTQRAYKGGNNQSIRLNLENLCYVT